MLRDPQLRKNVAHAIDVIQAKRARLVAEKTDWQALRTAAAAIRDEALANLGAYLEQFEERCTAAGGMVHWAADAAEARRIILEILREEKADEVIKIKTMTSAEIQLNPFLEAAGVRTYETDLAEIILQLGEGEPSHIVVPALHVNRSQVREIFARRMGIRESVGRSEGADGGGAELSAAEVSDGADGDQRREFSDCGDGRGGGGGVGGQRAHVPDAAADDDYAGGN